MPCGCGDDVIADGLRHTALLTIHLAIGDDASQIVLGFSFPVLNYYHEKRERFLQRSANTRKRLSRLALRTSPIEAGILSAEHLLRRLYYQPLVFTGNPRERHDDHNG